MPTFFGMTMMLQAAPATPSKGGNWGMWYILVVVAVVAFIAFWILRRVSDIAAKRKTEAMIREVGEPKSMDAELPPDKEA